MQAGRCRHRYRIAVNHQQAMAGTQEVAEMEIALRKTRAMHLRQHRQHGGQNVQGARISCRWRIQSRPVGRE